MLVAESFLVRCGRVHVVAFSRFVGRMPENVLIVVMLSLPSLLFKLSIPTLCQGRLLLLIAATRTKRTRRLSIQLLQALSVTEL